MLGDSHRAVADLLGTEDPGEVVFGPNMTSLTYSLSRAIAKTWRPGDQVIVTCGDHDANVSPWVQAAHDAGARVKRVGLNPSDCTLDLEQLRRYLSTPTRLVAVGCASNATGTIYPVEQITEWAHQAGAEVFVDAVHYAPHRLMDVRRWRCDYLACSAYKFFGPHVGILWGRRERLEQLPVYKLRPAPNELPGQWMTGTQNHEGIAGVAAAIGYLEDLGRSLAPAAPSRRAALEAAYQGITRHERQLARRFLDGVGPLDAFRLWGTNRLEERLPTFALTHRRRTPGELADQLGKRGIFTWHGNFYALSLTEALGLEPEGLLRIGLLHYNRLDEVDRVIRELALMVD
jgi:cysteine desulfurase family protein (TIGR01976 family)